MASARLTGTSESVSTYGGAGLGRDYTSLATWEAATDVDCVATTTSHVLEVYNDGEHDDTVTISGATTNATYFRIIRAASGERHTGVTGTGARFNTTLGADTFVFTISEPYFNLQDVGITANGTGNVSAVIINTTFAYIVGCLIYGLTTTGTSNTVRGIHVTANGTIVLVDNGVFNIVNGPSASQGQGILLGSGNTCYAYNNTVVNCQYYGIRRSLGTLVAKNNIVSGTQTNDDFSGTFDATSDYNASSDGSAPGSNSKTFANFSFSNQSSGDFHLLSGDSSARDNGTDLSADATFPFNDDIDLITIINWSIGFDSDGSPSPGGGGSGVGGAADCECPGTPEEVDAANGALSYLGVAHVVSFEDGTKQASLLRSLFAQTRRRLQQQYRWEFCLRRKAYTAADVVANVPTWGFNYAFLLPTNMLQLWDVNEPHENPRYRMENKYLLINEDTPKIMYGVDEPDPSKWSASFHEALELKLASRMAMTLLHKPEIMQLYEEMFLAKVADAIFLNDIQHDDYSAYSGHFTGARLGTSMADIPLELD